ncbi:MAG: RNA polymerase sigma factor [Micropepsaceae bacterium]
MSNNIMSRDQDDWYIRIAEQWGAAMQRIARSCEADPDRRRDVLQEMHVAVWKSHPLFDGRCSERTWIYRIASNVAANHVNRERRRNTPLVSLDRAGDMASNDQFQIAERDIALQKLFTIIDRLDNPDRSVITLYLEGLDAATISDVTGMSPGAVATRISRIKTLLAHHFKEVQHD